MDPVNGLVEHDAVPSSAHRECCLNGRRVLGIVVGVVTGAGASILTLYLMGQMFTVATQVPSQVLAMRIAIGAAGGGLVGFLAVKGSECSGYYKTSQKITESASLAAAAKKKSPPPTPKNRFVNAPPLNHEPSLYDVRSRIPTAAEVQALTDAAPPLPPVFGATPPSVGQFEITLSRPLPDVSQPPTTNADTCQWLEIIYVSTAAQKKVACVLMNIETENPELASSPPKNIEGYQLITGTFVDRLGKTKTANVYMQVVPEEPAATSLEAYQILSKIAEKLK